MKIFPKQGIDKLLFGMKQSNVEALYGKPNKEYKDEDDNLILLYNEKKLRLTFYKDENFRLGYIVASSPQLELFEQKVIGREIEEMKKELNQKGLVKFTKEAFDTVENFFNEENWLILQAEYGEVIKFEIGAIINDKDEFDWKFKK